MSIQRVATEIPQQPPKPLDQTILWPNLIATIDRLDAAGQERNALGLAGEMIAYHWLLERDPGQVDEQCKGVPSRDHRQRT